MMAPQYLLLVLVGLAALGWGFWAAHRWPSPRHLLPGLVSVLGVLLLMIGALLTFLPRFFLE